MTSEDKMKIAIDCIVLGFLDNNVYYLSDGKKGILIDPSCEGNRILKWLDNHNVSAIVLTHFHFDHIGAAAQLRDSLGVEVYATEKDALFVENPDAAPGFHRKTTPCIVDKRLVDGEFISIGEMNWKVIETPGHSHGSMCLYTSDVEIEGVLPNGIKIDTSSNFTCNGVCVSGDTLFYHTHGRTDYADGSQSDMIKSLQRLACLPDNTLVLPGHGHATTISAERGIML